MFSRDAVNDVPGWAADASARTVRRPGGRGKFTEEIARDLGFELRLEEGVSIEATSIYIGEDVRIGRGTRIDADTVFLGDMATIAPECTLVSGEITISDGALVGERVHVDLAGGRNLDSSLLLGPASLIGSWAHVNTCRSVIIDTESAISPGVMIFTHSFWQSVLDGYSASFQPVRIESNTSVGAGSQILPGVRIGSGSVVMANSTVISNVAPETLVGGVPAAVLRREIRRPFDGQKKYRAVSRMLELLVRQLGDRGCRITTMTKGAEYEIGLADGEASKIKLVAERGRPPGAGEVVISTVAWDNAGSGSLFDLERGRALGPETRVAFEVRNHLRRYGIRFEPYGWRADFRRGVQ